MGSRGICIPLSSPSDFIFQFDKFEAKVTDSIQKKRMKLKELNCKHFLLLLFSEDKRMCKLWAEFHYDRVFAFGHQKKKREDQAADGMFCVKLI